MIGRNRSRWKTLLAILACLAVPLLAIALLLGAAAMEMDRSSSGRGRDLRSHSSLTIASRSQQKKFEKAPVSIKINSWVDVLRTFYFDIFPPDPVPNVTPVFPGVRKDERLSKP
jgi:hypothetical protein